MRIFVRRILLYRAAVASPTGGQLISFPTPASTPSGHEGKIPQRCRRHQHEECDDSHHGGRKQNQRHKGGAKFATQRVAKDGVVRGEDWSRSQGTQKIRRGNSLRRAKHSLKRMRRSVPTLLER